MATVQTNVSESVYNIKKWLGVNEAEEGEATLKFGEAAKMRNFRITSGGALQKRPGSKNIAGLMTQYNAVTATTGEKVLFTTKGIMSEGFPMYPRISTDSVGNVIQEGTSVSVSEENAAANTGKYYKFSDEIKQLAGCLKNAAVGDETVTGGAIKLGTLTRIALGGTGNTGGLVEDTGTQSINTFSELKCTDGEFAILGTESTRERAFDTTAGFKTQDVGGFLEQDGVFYKYYGAKTENYVSGNKWKKYKCIRQENISYYTYYTQSAFYFVESGYLSDPQYGYSGYTSYSFNSSTGTFSGSGSSSRVSGGSSGTIYQVGSSTSCKMVTTTATSSETSTYSYYQSDAQGPYTGTSTYYTYSRGDYLSDVIVESGKKPEADSGMQYVTSFTESGTSYTVMTDQNGNYYAYCASEDTTEYYTCTFGWYGYPLQTIADSYDWSFYDTYSEPNTSTDSEVRGIWSGFVNSSEVLCAACNGHLWELTLENGVWSKTSCGLMDTSKDVYMFGFDEKLYIMNGVSYKVWDGTTLSDVEGYRPLVTISVVPSGGGTSLEQINKLNGLRRCWFSPDGTSTVFKLPESGVQSIDWVKDLTAGTTISASDYTADLENGKITFATAPVAGVNTIEIAWTMAASYRSQVTAMRYAELYNGVQDTRVFIYGNGTNKAFYSGLDYDGNPRADYFPDMNEAAVGDSNTPITAMVRHYNRLLCFKLDSAWSLYYDTITLADGSVTAGFYVSPVNRSIGDCAPGQAILVENRPRTLDGRSVIEWRATSSSGNITGDQRNAQRISQRVDNTIRTFDLVNAKTFYDKTNHEYYVIDPGGQVLVNNVEADVWYIYTGINAACMISYIDELYYGTSDGWLTHFSLEYTSDNGEKIDAHWESGAIDFAQDFRRKYSAMLWVGIKPEKTGYLAVTAETDKKSDFTEYSFTTSNAGAVPEMQRIKLKAKKFTYYKLILDNNTNDTSATVVSADIRVRGTGYVR